MKRILDSQSGAALILTVLAMAAFIPLYFYATSDRAINVTAKRHAATEKLYLENAVLSLAELVSIAYRTNITGCATATTPISTPLQNGPTQSVNLCLPAGDAARVENELQIDNPFRLAAPNAGIQARINLNSPPSSTWRWPTLSLGWPTAEAQVENAVRPALGAVPNVTVPAPPPPRACNGVDLFCVTLRVCPYTADCSDGIIFLQRIGFSP